MSLIKTTKRAELYLYRANTINASLSATEYTPEISFMVGIDEITPTVSATDLTHPIPILDGTPISDGTHAFVATSASAVNSTNNTTLFKQGCGLTDNTAQNLNSISGNWFKGYEQTTLLNPVNFNHYTGFWIYFSSNAYTMLRTLNPLQFRVDDTTVGRSRSITFDNKNKFKVGWNWVDCGKISDFGGTLNSTDTVDKFSINIWTAQHVNAWDEGDVVFDLLRQWEDSDIIKEYVTGYPKINLNNSEATRMAYLTTTQASGFNINGYADFNNDTVKLMTSKARFKSRSKSDNDELIFVGRDRIIT